MTQRKRKFFVQWNLLTQGKVKRFYALKIPDFSLNLELIAHRAKRLSLTN